MILLYVIYVSGACALQSVIVRQNAGCSMPDYHDGTLRRQTTMVMIVVVRPSFPMMTITSSMMMMMSCLVDPVGAEVANQSNSGLHHSSTLGAWVCRAG